MKLNRIAAAAAVAAAIAAGTVSGLAVTQHDTVAVALSADSQSVDLHAVKSQLHTAAAHTAAAHTARKPAPADPSLAWLVSPGGQAQVTFNNEVNTLAGDLVTEAQAPTVANHLVFEADARVVRAEAEKILHTRALLPTHNRAAYKRMLKDFITVANLLQPGPGYGTTPQDDAAWNTALKASDITVW
jgi:ABC-type Fe3+ transport system substrate-binding protein